MYRTRLQSTSHNVYPTSVNGPTRLFLVFLTSSRFKDVGLTLCGVDCLSLMLRLWRDCLITWVTRSPKLACNGKSPRPGKLYRVEGAHSPKARAQPK